MGLSDFLENFKINCINNVFIRFRFSIIQVTIIRLVNIISGVIKMLPELDVVGGEVCGFVK